MSKKIYALALSLFVLALGAMSSTAQASNGILLDQTTITANGRLTLNPGSVVCTVSLTLRLLNNPILKVTSPHQALVIDGSITDCSGLGMTGGRVLIPTTGSRGIPVSYAGFTGTLPNITGIRVNAANPGFLISGSLASCLYQGNLNGITFGVSGGAVRTASFTGTNSLPLSSGSFLCPGSGTISGVLTVLPPIPNAILV